MVCILGSTIPVPRAVVSLVLLGFAAAHPPTTARCGIHGAMYVCQGNDFKPPCQWFNHPMAINVDDRNQTCFTLYANDTIRSIGPDPGTSCDAFNGDFCSRAGQNGGFPVIIGIQYPG
ncbi:hypothetical protein BU23DRAFT_599136 [Bimuria novae-zelandiae CBS 107.79]|uniref:Uncharacterized protein n=1 Tax=Bimuria novae-zelandiae CBS 107.79 TaxID=1447943 RepID=A0A6A5V7S3_9PLEO|nr:hypothetical protein BU23DRAFT_599136 [Bimuria novae-zelandiae CBS 107.79]